MSVLRSGLALGCLRLVLLLAFLLRVGVLDPPAGAGELGVEHIEELARNQRQIRRLVVQQSNNAGLGLEVNRPHRDGTGRIAGHAVGVRRSRVIDPPVDFLGVWHHNFPFGRPARSAAVSPAPAYSDGEALRMSPSGRLGKYPPEHDVGGCC